LKNHKLSYGLLPTAILILTLFTWGDLTAETKAVNSFKSVTIEIKVDTLRYQLPDRNLLANSERVVADSLTLVKNQDYGIDYISGSIEFYSSSTLSPIISVSYYLIPDFLTQRYLQYELQNISDTLSTLAHIKKRKVLFEDDSKLIVSGSKTFSLSFSNQQSYDLKQSLYMTLDGELSTNMKIEGKLSDSQSPLTPEGDSREISSIDQVYLKLYGRQYSVVFGDQEHEFNNTYLMRYQTRFEGLNLQYFDRFGLQGAIALNNGKQATNLIQGVEGKQGPYYLNANTTGQNVQVIAGSEKVSVNGTNLQRGSDYSIDYSDGSLTFKILITSNSRIIVEFQYTDEYYAQSTYLNSAYTELTPSLRLNYHLISQVDDRENPLLWSFSANDKDSLRLAGDNDIWGQGIVQVEPGSGQYIQKLDIANNYVYYEYSLSDSADYALYFSYVGYGRGDYEPFGQNRYRYTGINQGSWMPYKKLIAPTRKTNLGLNLTYRNAWADLNLEGMFSDNDKNTLSGLNDNDNRSMIYFSMLKLHPEGYRLNPLLSLSYQRRNKASFTFSNLTPAGELYEFSEVPVADSLAQQQMDATMQISNPSVWSSSISARYKDVEKKYLQRFLKADNRIAQVGVVPSFNWYAIYSRQNYDNNQTPSSDLHYHILESSWNRRILTLKARYFIQRYILQYSEADSLDRLEGTQSTQFNPQIQLSDGKVYNSSLSYTREDNSEKRFSNWSVVKKSSTLQFNQMLNKTDNTLNLALTHREIESRTTGVVSLQDNKQQFDLLDFRSTHRLWDNSMSVQTSYSLNQLEFYPKIQELQYVGTGQGFYDSTGVQVSNGDYDYFYVNSGQSELSTEINANLNTNFHLSPKLKPGSLWHKLRLDSGYQVTENTSQRSDWKLYLLLPSETFSTQSTIYGRRSMQQYLWLDIWKKYLTGNLRYDISNVIDNRYQQLNRTYTDSKELVLDWKNIYGNRLQTSWRNSMQEESRYSSVVSTNEASAVLFRNINTQINTQITATYTREKGDNRNESVPYTISSYKLNPSVSWFMRSKYRLTSDFTTQYNSRSGSDFFTFLPEKRDGLIFLWSVRTFYKLNSFTSGSFEYSGKSYPQETIQHELKMEFRAEL
jgi:hypothetical protein